MHVPEGKPGKRRYGCWAGRPNGMPEDITRCVAAIYAGSRFISQQCTRVRGFGPNEEYCKQHAKKVTDGSDNKGA